MQAHAYDASKLLLHWGRERERQNFTRNKRDAEFDEVLITLEYFLSTPSSFQNQFRRSLNSPSLKTLRKWECVFYEPVDKLIRPDVLMSARGRRRERNGKFNKS